MGNGIYGRYRRDGSFMKFQVPKKPSKQQSTSQRKDFGDIDTYMSSTGYKNDDTVYSNDMYSALKQYYSANKFTESLDNPKLAYSQKEKSAVYRFSGSAYRSIRETYKQAISSATVNNETIDNKLFAKYGQNGNNINDMEHYIAKHEGSWNNVLYRGITVKGTDKEVESLFKEGALINQYGPSSWSKDFKVSAKQFTDVDHSTATSHSVLFIQPHGARHAANIEHMANFTTEREVLQSWKAHQRVVRTIKVKSSSGGYTYYVFVDDEDLK